MDNLCKDLTKVFDSKTKDVAYPKNQQQMEKTINQFVSAGKKVKSNLEKLDKILDENRELMNSFHNVFSYLGHEQSEWISNLGKRDAINDVDEIFHKAKRIGDRL